MYQHTSTHPHTRVHTSTHMYTHMHTHTRTHSSQRMGYLAATQSFHENLDVVMLTTNLIKKVWPCDGLVVMLEGCCADVVVELMVI